MQEKGSGTAAEARAAAEAKVAELLRAWKLVDDADAAVYAAAVAKFDARTRQLENIALGEAKAKAEAAEAAARLAKAEAARATAKLADAKQKADAKRGTNEAKPQTKTKPKPPERAATRNVSGDVRANPARAARRAGGA